MSPTLTTTTPCYLPDGRIIFDSTSTFQGVPCVGGGDYVANLHLMNPDGTNIRRLCFDQDNDWYPVVLPSGRVMYLRWEYTDSAHYFSRVLMSMNPDGTGQTAVYGSNSYWPNATVLCAPAAGQPDEVCRRSSPATTACRAWASWCCSTRPKAGRKTRGAMQRIPGYGKPVKGIIKDSLVNGSWPKFLHPYPLSDKYFLVSCKPTPEVGLGHLPGGCVRQHAVAEGRAGLGVVRAAAAAQDRAPAGDSRQGQARPRPMPRCMCMTSTPGAGLRGVPRGTVKNLRVFQYEYSYRNQGGHYFVGMEGGWDVRRIIGTVPVEEDGSAMFRIPANTPVALQPLDEEGKALQQMRSWLVGMPGEYVSCVGLPRVAELHGRAASRASPRASRRWTPRRGAGPSAGSALCAKCSRCWTSIASAATTARPGRPNLSDTKIIPTSGGISPLPQSYVELHPYVRRNGPEGDYHLLTPLEFHANTSLLVQMLRKGHHNVKLDAEAWDRLITWIDINVPAYGTYHEVAPIPRNFEKRRYEAKKKYAERG